jgi:hypothetical protein
MICLRNKDQQDAIYLIYFNNHPLNASNRLTIHHQEVVYCIYSVWCLSCTIVLAASQRRCMINSIRCIYAV